MSPFDMERDPLPPVDDDLFDRARIAVGDYRRETPALKSGVRSARLLDLPDVATWHQQQVQAIETDLGGPDELSSLARGSVREAARLLVILGDLGDDLLARGVLSSKGKTRAATMTYLSVLDRFVRLSGTLGLARRSKQVVDLARAFQESGR